MNAVTGIILFVVGSFMGFLVGHTVGTWAEHRVWLEAIDGREKMFLSKKTEKEI